jgi:hypothetical protein
MNFFTILITTIAESSAVLIDLRKEFSQTDTFAGLASNIQLFVIKSTLPEDKLTSAIEFHAVFETVKPTINLLGDGFHGLDISKAIQSH